MHWQSRSSCGAICGESSSALKILLTVGFGQLGLPGRSTSVGFQPQVCFRHFKQFVKTTMPTNHGASDGEPALGSSILPEAHYPALLAQRATECLLRHFLAKGIKVSRPLRLHDKSVAVQGKQTKKHRALVPEYYKIVLLPRDREPPAHAKQLPPHLMGKWGTRRMMKMP